MFSVGLITGLDKMMEVNIYSRFLIIGNKAGCHMDVNWNWTTDGNDI